MISCAFPPTGGPGVQRSAKFAKYLPEFGWTPVVWAADHLPDLPRDESLLADQAPDLDVRRLPARDPRWRLRGARKSARGRRNNLLHGIAWRGDRLLTRMYTRMVPDHLAPWALRSYRTCRRIIESENIDAIYSTYSPASNHLLAWLLKRSTGKPWIADFRDLWTDDYCYPFRGHFRERLDRRLEQAFLRAADAVVAVTESQTGVLRRRLPDQAGKFTTITNGVDLSDFEQLDRADARHTLHGPDDRFILTFTGWFLSDRVHPGLIEGITRFGRWVRDQQGDFEFRVVGSIADDMLRRFNADGVTVNAPGYRPHDEAVRHMVAADALLLLIPDGSNAATLITGKIFEYLASQRPILLVTPPGDSEAGNLLARCNAGVHAIADADSVFTTLRNLWLDWRAGRIELGCSPEHLAPLSRKHLAGKLAGVLTSLVRQPASQ